MGAATLSHAICFCCSSHPKTTALLISSPPLLRIYPKSPPLSLPHPSIPGLVLGPFSPWSGLKQCGSSVSPRNHARKDKGKYRGKVVYASLFGVGAPEVLVIGVVALLAFGPKGLAEVARNLGKTLRAFQPTIRELQEVSREFKSTLEQEIGLDEVASSTNYINKSALYANEKQATADPNGKPSTGPYTSEELLKVTEEQLTASAATSQMEASTPEEQRQESTSETLAAITLKETGPTQAA